MAPSRKSKSNNRKGWRRVEVSIMLVSAKANNSFGSLNIAYLGISKKQVILYIMKYTKHTHSIYTEQGPYNQHHSGYSLL
jgi:hypothetical protein